MAWAHRHNLGSYVMESGVVLRNVLGNLGAHIGESVTKSQTSVLQEDRGTTNLPLVKVRECSAFIRDNLC